jgi:antitoxin VapB
LVVSIKGVKMPKAIAKVFSNGRSQAVRLPKQFRFKCDEVFITRENERIILEPKPNISWKEFFLSEPCPDFSIERDMSPPQKRELF